MAVGDTVLSTLRLFLGDEPKEYPLDLDLLCWLHIELKLESDKLVK